MNALDSTHVQSSSGDFLAFKYPHIPVHFVLLGSNFTAAPESARQGYPVDFIQSAASGISCCTSVPFYRRRRFYVVGHLPDTVCRAGGYGMLVVVTFGEGEVAMDGRGRSPASAL